MADNTIPTAKPPPVTEQNALPLKYAWLTVVLALATLLIKSGAAWITGSVGLFSDAVESIVNVVTSLLLVALMRIAKAPPDAEHPFGHDKAEYFANGVQGTLVMIAACGIAAAAGERLVHPKALEAEGLGLALALGAALLNLGGALWLMRKGRELRSSALQGEGAHLMSDVATSAAVFLGVVLVFATGKEWLDPLVALLVCLWVAVTGARLLRSSVLGLMDTSLPGAEREVLLSILERYKSEHEIDYHALRSRVSGARNFVSVHILVPGDWTVSRGHQLLDRLESEIVGQIPGTTIFTHLEPLGEPASFEDIEL